MTNELKPCPKCGKLHLHVFEDIVEFGMKSGFEYYRIICNCGMCVIVEMGINSNTYDQAKIIAREKWNNRPENSLHEHLDRYKRAYELMGNNYLMLIDQVLMHKDMDWAEQHKRVFEECENILKLTKPTTQIKE